MKKTAILLAVSLLFLVSCGARQAKVDKRIENGVEVVLNHKEPYVIPGRPTRLILEREFAISTANEELANAGLTDIYSFDVDEGGDIYIIQWNVPGNYIYKFNKNGKLLLSFCRRGQGPGEIEWGGTVMLTARGEIFAKDPSKQKFLVYSREGQFLRETRLPRLLEFYCQFKDEWYLTEWQEQTPDNIYAVNHVALCDPNIQHVHELVSFRFRYGFNPSNRITVGDSSFICGASPDRIFIGDSTQGYEIRVFAWDGKLMRRIRKEFTPVPITAEFKSAWLSRLPAPARERYSFAPFWPPFRYLFADDEGRLFVMTREPGLKRGEFMYDVFNAEGVFICRTSLANSDPFYPRAARALRGRIYSIDTDEDGYKVLDVYRMKWE